MEMLRIFLFLFLCFYCENITSAQGDSGERVRQVQSLLTLEIQNIRKELNDFRKESMDFRKESMNLRKESKDTLNGLQNQLEHLQRNPVPIGFIYVQLSNQPPPSSLWPQTQWENISSIYAGLFFRVVGGTSAALGETQNENSPRIIEVKNESNGGSHHINIPSNGNWSLPLWTGSDTWCIAQDKTCYWSMFFKQSAGEVRPRNQAVQIWIRIN